MATNRIAFRILALLLAVGAVGTVFFTAVRPAYLNWGATAEERRRPLPGDEIVPNAATQQTRAITIHTPITEVWPWLAQTGQDRGGSYSFDLLENLVGCEMPTHDVLRTEKQVWHAGDKLWMYPSHKAGGAGFATLRTFELGRVLGFGAVLRRPRWNRPLATFILAAALFQLLTLGQPPLIVGVPLVILAGATLRDRGRDIRSRVAQIATAQAQGAATRGSSGAA